MLLCGPRREKTCFQGFANNKGLISVFVISLLGAIIYERAISEINFNFLARLCRFVGNSEDS